MVKNIIYGIAQDGTVLSNMNGKWVFNITGEFERTNQLTDLLNTKKIPIPIKNKHRKFWGLPILRTNERIPEDGYIAIFKGNTRNPRDLKIVKYSTKYEKMLENIDNPYNFIIGIY